MTEHYSWNWATICWVVWLGLFAGLEGWALVTRQPQYTLSYQVWHIDAMGGFFKYFVFAFFGWLLGHMAFGWWTAS